MRETSSSSSESNYKGSIKWSSMYSYNIIILYCEVDCPLQTQSNAPQRRLLSMGGNLVILCCYLHTRIKEPFPVNCTDICCNNYKRIYLSSLVSNWKGIGQSITYGLYVVVQIAFINRMCSHTYSILSISEEELDDSRLQFDDIYYIGNYLLLQKQGKYS